MTTHQPQHNAHDELDPAAILVALGVSDAIVGERVRVGWDTAIWRVQRGDATYALRVFEEGAETRCQHEAMILRLMAAGGIPVPEIHAEGLWRGHPALLRTGVRD